MGSRERSGQKITAVGVLGGQRSLWYGPYLEAAQPEGTPLRHEDERGAGQCDSHVPVAAVVASYSSHSLCSGRLRTRQ